MSGPLEGAGNGQDELGRQKEYEMAMEVAAKDGNAGVDNPRHIRFGALRCANLQPPIDRQLHDSSRRPMIRQGN